MIKHINGRPAAMMMASAGDSNSEGDLSVPTWDDIPSVKVDDIQTGRNIYIEVKEVNGILMTKASAGKIISCIREGFMPVLKTYESVLAYDSSEKIITSWKFTDEILSRFSESQTGIYELNIDAEVLYSDPSGDLSKPFTSIEPISADVPFGPDPSKV